MKGWYGNRQAHSLASRGIRTGNMKASGWHNKLRNTYINFDEWRAYSEMYGLHRRLGYDSPEEAWEDNPHIKGSVKPEDYGIYDEEFESRGRVPKQQKIKILKDEFIEVYEEWREWSIQKDRIMNEMFDKENPPSKERKRELYSYIQQYYDEEKDNFTHKLFEIQDEVKKLNNERITYGGILEERGRQ